MNQFQAWAHVNSGEYQYWQRVGEPQASEALAWREVHNIGLQFWPENAPRRRLFESRCKVDPLIRVPIKSHFTAESARVAPITENSSTTAPR